jgi:hypothetical protein
MRAFYSVQKTYASGPKKRSLPVFKFSMAKSQKKWSKHFLIVASFEKRVFGTKTFAVFDWKLHFGSHL